MKYTSLGTVFLTLAGEEKLFDFDAGWWLHVSGFCRQEILERDGLV